MRILILSHTRCGSTTLSKWLEKELGVELDETPYDKTTFNSVFEKENIIRKIVVEEYFPTKKEIDRFDRAIFLIRNNNIDTAISYTNANNSEEWHKEYSVTKEWIENNEIGIINISNYISGLKNKIWDYAGFHITYEDVYINKNAVNRILDYVGIESPKYLSMLGYDKKYRKDDNLFIKKYKGLI
jgi:LPS sulfotransferase NodH